MQQRQPVTDLGHGIVCLDTGYIRSGLACFYLIEDDGEYAVVECGTRYSVALLNEYMAERGIRAEAVRYVIPTHVHLDHAGGAGVMMAQFPEAQLVVHSNGARHLIDPSKLAAGARAVYGDARFDELYGEIVPVDAARLVSPVDGEVLLLGGRALQFFDTPGHANHHFCLWDERSRSWFSGDVFGLRYPEFAATAEADDYLITTTTPVQFDPAKLIASVELLAAKQPAQILLTHYGAVSDVARCAAQLCEQINDHCAIAERYAALPAGAERCAAIEAELLAYFAGQIAARRPDLDSAALLPLLAMDINLNAQGLDVWLARRA
jgi:glyoxylase-like metal-dependent hydrolase (beta-lactamase superfamily II)